jgi:hypothetical protein
MKEGGWQHSRHAKANQGRFETMKKCHKKSILSLNAGPNAFPLHPPFSDNKMNGTNEYQAGT